MPDPDRDPEFAPLPSLNSKKPRAPLVDNALAWVDRHRRAVLIAGVVFQVLVLLSMVASALKPRLASASRTVLLRVIPVDPRDLFRGDYVILSYEISRMPVAGAGPSASGQPVFVTLAPEPDNRHYRGVSASLTPGALPYIRGTLSEAGRITFGIESYFVPEGQGKPYEAAAVSRKLSAEILLAPDGQAALKSLVIE